MTAARMGLDGFMARRGSRSSLVGSLASVAVAAAAGSLATAATGGASLPVMLAAGGIAGSGEAMMQTIDAIKDRIDRVPETRALRQAIEDAVSASVGKFPDEPAGQGVDLAAEIVRVRGLTTERIAYLGFDAARAANMVLAESHRRDPGWAGGEDVYRAAEAAIRATYEVLTGALRDQEQVLLPVLNHLRDDLTEGLGQIQDKVENIDQTTRETGRMVGEQLAQASGEDVLEYLRRRIDDWDRSEWISPKQDRRPSQVERRLNLVTRGDDREELSVAEALDRHEHLVILGGPGSGKSWLARRIAREAAETAYAQLVRGAPLQKVEIPLLTTWETWWKLPGGARERLITASFDASLGVSDLGGTSVMKRLQTTLGGPSRVLAVIDALDEASDQSSVPDLMTSLLRIPGWRTVVTSRPGSWDGKGALRQRKEGVADLRPISWDDVTAFVRCWFGPEAATAEALLTRLKKDARLTDTATVPLLLTFYCLYAEDAPAEEPLPVLRRDLYNYVIDKLIQGDWTRDDPPQPRAARGLLMEWAWEAVKDAVTPAGLGDWGETFEPLREPDTTLARAMDHVAPAIVEADGRVLRRFRHRTLLEHLVVEHIAGLGPKKAARVLLPHLWFDPDWDAVAPAAIAAHPNRSEVLARILDQASLQRTDDARSVAADELDRHLLGVAAETNPEDWTEDLRSMLSGLRAAYVLNEPGRVARSSHWKQSNQAVLHKLLAALPGADPVAVVGLVSALPGLLDGEVERARAREGILVALAGAEPLAVGDLVAALAGLGPDEAERAQAREGIFAALPTVSRWAVGDLMAALPGVVKGEEERAQAREGIFAALPRSDRRYVGDLVTALLGVVDGEAERGQAREGIFAAVALPETNQEVVGEMVAALPGLVDGEAERAQAREGIFAAAALPGVNRWVVGDLMAALSGLRPDEAERTLAREGIFAALPGASRWAIRDMLAALPGLVESEAERAQARQGILAALPGSKPWIVGDLVEALPGLGPDEVERTKARDGLFAAIQGADLPGAGQEVVGDLVAALPGVVEGEEERARAREGILAAMPGANQEDLGDLVAALSRLGPDETERAQARARIFAALHDAGPSAAYGLVAELSGLVDGEAERGRLLDAILAALPGAGPSASYGLVTTLSGIRPDKAERAKARDAILAALPGTHPSTGYGLVAELPNLVDGEEEREKARDAVLEVISVSGASSDAVVRSLRALSTAPQWLRWLRME